MSKFKVGDVVIANEDFRGNRQQSSVDAYNTLKAFNFRKELTK